MTRLLEAIGVVVAALAGLAALVRFAPGYLSVQGFPLDEAWTQSVYARALAQTGQLAFNPGAAAPGVPSLLWTAVLAPIHLVAIDPASVGLATKLTGFALHAATAALLVWVLAAAGAGRGERLLGAGLVAVHPDLVAGSVSGVEIPLAALASCALLRAAQASRPWAHAPVSALAVLARPDLAVLSCALPLLAIPRADGPRLARSLGAAALGSAAALALVLGRDLALAGPSALVPAPSPAAIEMSPAAAQVSGFRDLLGQVPIVDSSLLLLLAAGAAVWRLRQADGIGAPVEGRLPAAGFLGGLVLCAVGFALHPPAPSRVTGAFGLADQRDALAALPLLVGLLPTVLRRGAEALLSPRPLLVARCALAALLVASVVVNAPKRHVLLASEARSVDDLGAAAGRLLAAVPPAEVAWAVFPGAIRYFGNAHVIDLTGASTPELRGGEAAAFLAAHPPRFLEIVPGRSDLDRASRSRMRAARLETEARNVWTGPLPAEERWIVLCAEPGATGQLTVDYRALAFRCAGAPPAAAPSPR